MVDSAEVLFLRGYKDAIMHFNMLDRNLAYCLQEAFTRTGSEVDLLTILSYSFDEKLKKVGALIEASGWKSEYSEFLALANAGRIQRNQLVHGDWRFVFYLPKPILFHAPAPFDAQGELNQEEFAALVSSFEHLSELFSKLRKKYPLPSENHLLNKKDTARRDDRGQR